jgi:hypothetical protein
MHHPATDPDPDQDDIFPAEPPAPPAQRVITPARPAQRPAPAEGDYADPAVAERARALHTATVRRYAQEPEPPALPAPATAAIGDYVHRLALPVRGIPADGTVLASHGRLWQWEAAASAWRRIA